MNRTGAPALMVGPVALGGRAFLAPMSGITDIGMRRLAMRFGASLVVSEMVASDDLALGDEEARTRAEGEGVAPHVVQLAGCDPRWMAEGARVAEAAGAQIVDINMGCPAKRVTGGWSGSALMRDLDHAVALVEATVAAVDVPVTLKMRLGWDDASLNAPELARRAVASGVRMVTVHGRTRQQFYKGRADWRAVAAVRAAIPGVPLVVNGDITSPGDARAALTMSGADAVMVGRAALGRPWCVGAIARALDGEAVAVPSRRRRLEGAVVHYETLLATYGLRMGIRHARKHLAAYADDALADGDAPGEGARLRARIVVSEDPGEVILILRKLYSDVDASLAA
ncbi:tRNA dihydrouridine synthase DusB [Pseudochelatococcus sp. B33]